MLETKQQSEATRPALRWLLLLALPVVLHVCVQTPAEPVFNGDSNRHVMTSIFFHDFLTDLPLSDPKQYAENYYEQYPALGLLIWPPLFHGVAGTLMLVFGTSVWVPRGLVFATFVLATWCVHRICRRRMAPEQAALVTAVFSTMPMVFLYSRDVMLEVPTLALCLLCIDRFDLWLRARQVAEQTSLLPPGEGGRRPDEGRHLRLFPWNLYFAAIAAALAALTRFDAVMLLPTLLLMAIFEGRWRRLFNRHVAVAAIVAVALLAPTYYVIWREMGDLHLRQAAENVSGTHSAMFASGALTYYPSKLVEQGGWAVAVFAAIGLLAAFRRENRSALAVFAALLIGTYITFTPLAERSARHAIYWLPAIAWLAVIGANFIVAAFVRISDRFRTRLNSHESSYGWAGVVSAAVLLTLTAATSFGSYVYRVIGYERAATVVIERTQPGDRIFIDGWWDGNFTYHVRHLDATRSRHIVRADKVLYDFTNVPTVDFKQFVETDCEMLEAIAGVEPACVVFEDPQPFGDIEISRRMRALIQSLPEQFPPIEVVPVNSTVPQAREFSLHVFGVDLPKLQRHIEAVKKGRESFSDSSPYVRLSGRSERDPRPSPSMSTSWKSDNE